MSGAREPRATLPLVRERAWLRAARAAEAVLPAYPRGGHGRLSLGHPRGLSG